MRRLGRTSYLALTLLLRVPLFAACVGLIACFAVLCVRFVRARCRSYRDAAFQLPWLGGLWAARGYDGASKLEGFQLRRAGEANERAVRAWACVRSGWVVREP
jgi:hypothetical protein